MTPQYVEMVLRGGLAGAHAQQWELFDLMFDTWPELAGCANEMIDGVMARRTSWRAWEEEGEKPTPPADEKKALVSAALRRMRPEPGADENDFEETLRDILDGWFRGVSCLEVDWQKIDAGKSGGVLAPRTTFWAHPNHFAWGSDGRLGLVRGTGLVPLPEHKFLVGIHKAKSGPALGASLLRPLAWWWCAANFASDWLLNLAQIFGLPFRWANHDPNASQGTVDAICSMLQNMGSAGWAAFPAGTTLELKDTGATGDRSPQGDLLDRADRYARMLVLGQTMSGSQDSSKGGGKAFGSVEADVKGARMDAAARYVCQVINQQLAPSILTLNYGNADECPEMVMEVAASAGTEDANRDKILSEMMPLPLAWLRDKYDVPAPGEDEETTASQTQDGKPQDISGEMNRKGAKDAENSQMEDVGNEGMEIGKDSMPSLASKLTALSHVADDALFAKQLNDLIDTL